MAKGKNNHLLSHGELRRIYKLCHDPEVPEDLRKAALTTFHFVKVQERQFKKASGGVHVVFDLKPMPAPWKTDEKILIKTRPRKTKKPADKDWRVALNQAYLAELKYRLSKKIKETTV